MNWSGERDNPENTENEQYRSGLSENLDALKGLPIFSGIPYEIVRLFAYTAKIRHYRSGDMIFRQGEMSKAAYLILSGKVSLSTEADQKVFPLQILEKSGFFGYMALLAEFEWPLGSQALEDTDILMLERESFRKILARFPEKCLLIAERLVQMRMKRMEDHMRILMKGKESGEELTDMF